MASIPMRNWTAEDFAPAEPAGLPVALAPRAAAKLSALEWSIVAMAERDTLASLREPGRFLSALTSLFGLKPANRLANERLEALRRISVLAWRKHWNVPKSELRSFFDAGFTPDHYELIQKSIGQARIAQRRKTTR
jgi:hypothetical protein